MAGGILLLNAERIPGYLIAIHVNESPWIKLQPKAYLHRVKMHVAPELKFTRVSSWMKSVSIKSPNVYSVTTEQYREREMFLPSQCFQHIARHGIRLAFFIPPVSLFSFELERQNWLKNIKANSEHKSPPTLRKKNPQSCCRVTVSRFIDSANLTPMSWTQVVPNNFKKRELWEYENLLLTDSSANEVKTAWWVDIIIHLNTVSSLVLMTFLTALCRLHCIQTTWWSFWCMFFYCIFRYGFSDYSMYTWNTSFSVSFGKFSGKVIFWCHFTWHSRWLKNALR